MTHEEKVALKQQRLEEKRAAKAEKMREKRAAQGGYAGPAYAGPPITVAVVDFSMIDKKGKIADERVGDRAEDGCLDAILKRSFRAIDPKAVDDATAARLSEGGNAGSVYQELGQRLGIDAVIIGGMGKISVRNNETIAKLISTRTGAVIAISKLDARVKRGFMTGQRVCQDLLEQYHDDAASAPAAVGP